jgi:hypothetical protein
MGQCCKRFLGNMAAKVLIKVGGNVAMFSGIDSVESVSCRHDRARGTAEHMSVLSVVPDFKLLAGSLRAFHVSGTKQS